MRTVPRIQGKGNAARLVPADALAEARWVALVIDGKMFAADQLVIALGVTVQGEKRVLGLVETATENRRVCAAFLRSLV